jgi:hypothetical protein
VWVGAGLVGVGLPGFLVEVGVLVGPLVLEGAGELGLGAGAPPPVPGWVLSH